MMGLVARQVGKVTRARSKATVPAFSVWAECVHLIPLLAAFHILGCDRLSVCWVEHRAVWVERLDRVIHVALLARSRVSRPHSTPHSNVVSPGNTPTPLP